ncbi:hypothetical protein EON67_01795 [archaeon]|nr:MAG: hypothetical protein EON67_01795 [archaeon]
MTMCERRPMMREGGLVLIENRVVRPVFTRCTAAAGGCGVRMDAAGRTFVRLQLYPHLRRAYVLPAPQRACRRRRRPRAQFALRCLVTRSCPVICTRACFCSGPLPRVLRAPAT